MNNRSVSHSDNQKRHPQTRPDSTRSQKTHNIPNIPVTRDRVERYIASPSSLEKHGYRLNNVTTSLEKTEKTANIVALKVHKTDCNGITLSAVDVQTGNTLLDREYNNPMAGTSTVDLNLCAELASKDVTTYMNRSTILVMYDGHTELNLLRIAHRHIVDLKILSEKAVVAVYGPKKEHLVHDLSELARGLGGLKLPRHCGSPLPEAQAMRAVVKGLLAEGGMEAWVGKDSKMSKTD
ncbi:uncharacterized protein DSM5745_09917 [Aspergillus mulundensis]|uniref:Uncharacterized protein n=1 Tax=Aspergillus mulundensis TaxID=1810919 RepID=A0A3D8QRP9_9EURO|nr:hypothetical protein DSM5745_09917 [Aspergillus mulundensis]RDW64506.1 hypothetical protein DSM5745_09917 [Aspergillus mulundensis]